MAKRKDLRGLSFTEPMECLQVAKVPEGPNWIYELKLDGYRAQAIFDDQGLRLLSRNGKDFTKTYPTTVASLAEAMLPGSVFDGELVAVDKDGKSSFSALQNASADTQVTFYAFDIITHRWADVSSVPLRDRLQILDSAFHPSEYAQLCASFPGPVEPFIAGVRQMGGEGVVGKRLDSRYEPGRRSGAWVRCA